MGEVADSKKHLMVIAVVRGEEVLPPAPDSVLEQDDTVILAGDDHAYEEFMRIHQNAAEQTPEK